MLRDWVYQSIRDSTRSESVVVTGHLAKIFFFFRGGEPGLNEGGRAAPIFQEGLCGTSFSWGKVGFH